MIITIDGSSGTGKSTVSKEVAKRLNWTSLDTGALYRSFAWYVLYNKIDPEDSHHIRKLVKGFDVHVTRREHGVTYHVCGIDVTSDIRTPEVTDISSKIATYSFVRKKMVALQRQCAKNCNIVAEGRDMGTVVFPRAFLKVFLTASLEERARRRFNELRDKNPQETLSIDQVKEDIKTRDERDSTRKSSPLKPAKKAVFIDTSYLSSDEVIEKILLLHEDRRMKSCFRAKIKQFFHAVFYQISALTIALFFRFFYRVEVYGFKNLKKGPGFIIANHLSFLDPPLINYICRQEVHYLAKESLFKVPFFGSLIRFLNAHPLTGKSNDRKVFKIVERLLLDKQKVLLFPEGERSYDGTLLPFKRGVSLLVLRGQALVYPIYIHGAEKAWNRASKSPSFFKKITCVFGKPIQFFPIEDSTLSHKELQMAMAKRMQESICKLKEWVDHGMKGPLP